MSRRPGEDERGAGPLAGVTVVDLTRVLAGPFATLALADLGARVIKVEPPHGDDARRFGPFVNGDSAYFASLNRGKRSIALDLKRDRDRAVFESLLEGADVLVENYRAGAMERLGYGWDALRERYPRLVYAAVSGFGHTGPYSGRAAYDLVVQAMGGLMSVTGHPHTGPTRVGASIGDLGAGLFALAGVLAALYDRERTGKGVKVDVGMLDCQVALLENAVARYFASGEIPRPLGARHPSITPFDAFRTATDPVVVAAGNDALFAKLCGAVDRRDLAEREEFASNDARTANHEPLKNELERTLAAMPAEHWLAVLDEAGVPCAPINDVGQVVVDPHVKSRNMIIEADDPDAPLSMPGNPIKLSGYDDPQKRPAAPRLDGDREAILSGLKRR